MKAPPTNPKNDEDPSPITQLDGLNDSFSSTSSVTAQEIPVISNKNQFEHRPRYRPRKSRKPRIVCTVKRSNNQLEALSLPTMMNINPRSIYNKSDEFHTLVTELEVDLITMSESWERESLPLDQLIKLDNYQVISNVHQRTGKGDRPTIIAN